MEIATWIVQGMLAIIFIMAGMMKATTPIDKLREKMAWTKEYSDGKIKLIGILEVLGAVGLIAPYATGILPQLTWLAAAALAIVMLFALRLHAQRNEKKEMLGNVVFLALLLFVAYSRFYCALLQ